MKKNIINDLWEIKWIVGVKEDEGMNKEIKVMV